MAEQLSEFGTYFRSLREARELTLRRFCVENGLDPGNISKMERGRLLPPDKERLSSLADCLGLEEASDERVRLYDLAYACRGEIPPDILNDEELVGRLPLLFRTLRGENLGEEELRALAERVRGA